MRENIKHIGSVLIVVALICLMISSLTAILEPKESKTRLQAFLNEEKEIDVFFFGSSHVRNGVFPMELWDEYGIVSYNLAGNGDTIPVSYWKLKMALDEKIPDVVIVDIFNMWPGKKISDIGIGQVHNSIDAFPLSINKIRATYDLIEDEEDRLGLLFKFSKYHTKWSSISKTNFNDNYTSTLYKGAEPAYTHVIRTTWTKPTSYEGLEYDDTSLNYLVKMIELCKSENIEIILINTGYDAGRSTQYFATAIPDLAEAYDVEYIDFTELDVIDFDTDLMSTGGNTHVNVSGGKKITTYLGECLVNEHGITDRRNDSQYDDWKQDYEEYFQLKISTMNNRNSIASELVAVADNDFSTIIYCEKNAALLQYDHIKELIENVSPSRKLEMLDTVVATGDEYLLVIDNVNMQVWEHTGDEPIMWETSFGTLNYLEKSLHMAGSSDLLFFTGEQPEVQIIVIDNNTGEIVSHTKWTKSAKIE